MRTFFSSSLVNEPITGVLISWGGGFFYVLLLTICIPRMGYHKLCSCTFLSGTVKCRVIYALYIDCML